MTQWYYNTRTHEVEEGRQSLASELDGPFDSREDAARVLEIIAERARNWAEDDAKKDGSTARTSHEKTTQSRSQRAACPCGPALCTRVASVHA